MTSSVAVFQALCRQLNTIQVDSLDELIDAVVALRFARPYPGGKRVALIGAGGGPSVLAGDEMERAGLTMPPFSKELQAELKKYLPVAGSIFGNPLDTPNLATPEAISAAMGVLGKVMEIDILVYHLGFHPISRWGFERFSSPEFLDPVVNALTEVRKNAGKPVVLILNPAQDLKGLEEFLIAQEAFVKAGFPVFYTLRRGARAMARLMAWKNNGVN
jgi:acetyltransferase